MEFAQLEARTKTMESFVEKIERKKEKYTDPLAEITDLVGLRVILYYQDDVQAVGRLIEQEFTVDPENSPRQGSDRPVDRFGYRSDHYLASLNDHRLGLAEYGRFVGKRAEIQVRTVMDHAWSAVDHKIRYKGADLPADLQRRLFRLKALLEVGDDQFAALRDASNRFIDSYEQSVTRGDLDVELDALSLRAYLDETGVLEHWDAVSQEQGFGRAGDAPPERKTAWTKELLVYLRRGGLTKLSEFEALLQSANSWGPDALKIVATEVDAEATEIANPSELAILMIIQVAMKDSDAVDEATWLTGVRNGLKKAFSVGDYSPPGHP